MQEVEKIAVRRALRVLNAVKDHIQYAIEFDGETHGNRELAVVKKRVHGKKYPYGSTRKHYLPYLETVKQGGVVNIPFGAFDGKVLSGNVSAACVHLFGKGHATVHRNDLTSTIDVLVALDATKVPSAAQSLIDLWNDDDED